MIPLDPVSKPQKPAEQTLPTIIAVDFDGTLCVNRYPQIGKPKQPVIDWLILQKQNGVKLILWTMREGEPLDAAVAWCAEHGLTFDAINNNLQAVQDKWGNNPRKVFANYYLDDSNI